MPQLGSYRCLMIFSQQNLHVFLAVVGTIGFVPRTSRLCHCEGRSGGEALHCTALHCTALHCTALHCTALHCFPCKPSWHLHLLKQNFAFVCCDLSLTCCGHNQSASARPIAELVKGSIKYPFILSAPSHPKPTPVSLPSSLTMGSAGRVASPSSLTPWRWRASWQAW